MNKQKAEKLAELLGGRTVPGYNPGTYEVRADLSPGLYLTIETNIVLDFRQGFGKCCSFTINRGVTIFEPKERNETALLEQIKALKDALQSADEALQNIAEQIEVL